MPTGDNPRSKANLKKFGSDKEPRSNGRKGGKASGKARRAQASITEALRGMMDDANAKQIAQMINQQAKRGNYKFTELVLSMMGEKPADKVVVSTVNEDAISRLDNAIKKRREDAEA